MPRRDHSVDFSYTADNVSLDMTISFNVEADEPGDRFDPPSTGEVVDIDVTVDRIVAKNPKDRSTTVLDGDSLSSEKARRWERWFERRLSTDQSLRERVDRACRDSLER